MAQQKIEAKNYRDLVVWQLGIKLAKDIYTVTEKFPRQEVYGLVDQIRRASVSIPSNIAEGQARKLPGEFKHFLRISLGSLAEVDTQLVIANELGYASEEATSSVNNMITELRIKIYALINSLPDR